MTDAERVRMNNLTLQIQRERSYQRFEELTRELFTLVAIKEHRFFEHQASQAYLSEKGWKLLPAVANRLIKQLNGVDKVEVNIPDAEDGFSEIRIENSFTDDHGSLLAIEPGTHLEIKLEAPTTSFTKRRPNRAWSRSHHRRDQPRVNNITNVPERSFSAREKTRQQHMCLYCGKPIRNKQLPAVAVRPGEYAHMECWTEHEQDPHKPN